ncbi:hypothetical protein C5Y97_15780 [Blastopirellula marina]|uniref:Uncharacterized protein n=1 Tax=Blastopirellula marina TaxID=124 RepID=A0A2S8FNC4_9BACT|nr:hypothetical protein C5Y98_15770 [Blastopirellula marina]PTL43479.1 hypothetical protein C5Y97_15780 [Blastopirellula marina]
MTEEDPIPRSYQEWRECITIRCGIILSAPYIRSRLNELRNASHSKTREFCGKYGQSHLNQVIRWFETALQEAS